MRPDHPDETGACAGTDLTDGALRELYARAARVRREVKGDHVFLRGLVEFSNHCRCNCLYCGLRRDNAAVSRFRMTDDEIVASARAAAQAGADTVVLQSGEDPAYGRERVAELIRKIKGLTGLAVTLSLGNRSPAAYLLWKKAGADRYLIKHETADPALYARMHPGDTLANRLDALKRLYDLGYEPGTGFIIGLPGQTLDILHRDIELVGEIKASMCGVGPFMPQQNTPLAGHENGSVERTLYAVAMLRIKYPHLNLPATTALASLAPDQGHQLALNAGANVIMPSFTPAEYSRNYTIYDGKTKVSMDDAKKAVCQTRDRSPDDTA